MTKQQQMVRRALVRRGVSLTRVNRLDFGEQAALARRLRGRSIYNARAGYVRHGLSGIDYGYQAPIRPVPSIIQGRVFSAPPLGVGQRIAMNARIMQGGGMVPDNPAVVPSGVSGLGCAGCAGAGYGCSSCPGTGMGFWQAAIGAAVQTAGNVFQAKYASGVQKTDIKAQRDITLAQIRSGNVGVRQDSKTNRAVIYGGAAVLGILALSLLRRKGK